MTEPEPPKGTDLPGEKVRKEQERAEHESDEDE